MLKTLVPSCILTALCLASGQAQTPPDQLLLKDYRPRSIFKIPQTVVERARHPVIDVHSHAYARTPEEIAKWVEAMDEVGVTKTIILAGNTGPAFAATLKLYGAHSNRFEVWCGLDLAGFEQPGFASRVIAELERCRRAGALGVGELSDKGRGLSGAPGLHLDDERMDPILKRCGELGLPINIHVGEDQWMYEPMDQHNDGLMNAWKWRIPEDPQVMRHAQVVATLERAVAKHPHTTFVACHFANCCADLDHLGRMLERFPNLYADIGARFAEISPIPRKAREFFVKYADRLMYGTDVTCDAAMYRETFRILETQDEHFYTTRFGKYHWPQHALDLPEPVLRQLYRGNATRVLPGCKGP